MQLVVNKYKTDKNVIFLFINTQEEKTMTMRQKEVKEFMQKHKYTFYVLLDEPLEKNNYKVVSEYDVSGIPVKFVLDRKGRIRFKTLGYNGNPKELEQELSTMIELTKNLNFGELVAARSAKRR